MINIFLTKKEAILKWYEKGELQTKSFPKKMLYGSKNKHEGEVKVDIYTGEQYKVVKSTPRQKLPRIPIPYPIYDHYDYYTATKLIRFKDINPETPRGVFFDIETTSLDPASGEITSICWLDTYTGEEFHTLNTGDEAKCIQGFIDYLNKHDILSLIGFNSNKFDIPYIEDRCLRNHIRFNPKKFIKEDVMVIANKLFYFGSLDVIAKNLGVERKLEVDNPIKLWNQRRYDELLKYNTQDVRVTKQIYEKLDMKEFLEALWKLTWFDYDRIGANSHISNMFYNKRMWEDGYCVSKADLKYRGDFGGGFNFNVEKGGFE